MSYINIQWKLLMTRRKSMSQKDIKILASIFSIFFYGVFTILSKLSIRSIGVISVLFVAYEFYVHPNKIYQQQILSLISVIILPIVAACAIYFIFKALLLIVKKLFFRVKFSLAKKKLSDIQVNLNNKQITEVNKQDKYKSHINKMRLKYKNRDAAKITEINYLRTELENAHRARTMLKEEFLEYQKIHKNNKIDSVKLERLEVELLQTRRKLEEYIRLDLEKTIINKENKIEIADSFDTSYSSQKDNLEQSSSLVDILGKRVHTRFISGV